MNRNKIVLGVISGIAIGAVAGILFAPAKGSKTRKRIMKKGNNYTNELKTKFEEMYHNAANEYDSAVEQTKEFATDHQPK